MSVAYPDGKMRLQGHKQSTYLDLAGEYCRCVCAAMVDPVLCFLCVILNEGKNVDMGWNQVQYTSKSEVLNSLCDLVTVVSRTNSGEARILGTAFPVFASPNNTLMLTASHVIEEAYKSSSHYSERRNARNLNHIPEPDNKQYELIGKWIKETDDLWCLLAVEEKQVQCFVTGACLRPPLDMAFLVLDTSHLKEITKVFAINSNILNASEEIVITSLITKENKRDLIARHGVITKVRSTGNLINAPIYETNIPIEAGASGGPVFRYTGDFNSSKEVIGIISSDFSCSDAFSNPSINGNSYVSIICSATPLNVENTDGTVLTFQDMCTQGLIKDFGDYIGKVQLTTYPDDNWHQSFPVIKNKHE